MTVVLAARISPLELMWIKHASRDHLQFTSMLRRRTQGEPLQYILGTQPFGPLNLLTRPPVLIPRPETEHWTIKLSHLLPLVPPRPLSLLDLGTGSGCIPLLLCHLSPPGTVHAHGVDISPDAIQLATDNAARCKIPSISHHKNTFTPTLASFLDPNNFPVQPPFDIVTSNPPYIPWSDYLNLPSSVKNYEDPLALSGGHTGLDFYHAIARLVSRKGFLSTDALVALEVGDGQAEVVQEIMRRQGCMRTTEVWLDPWDKRRTVIARM